MKRELESFTTEVEEKIMDKVINNLDTRMELFEKKTISELLALVNVQVKNKLKTLNKPEEEEETNNLVQFTKVSLQ